MRHIFVLFVAACGLDTSVEDGTYIGTISSGGCMNGSQLTIEVLDGKASFPDKAGGVFCSANESTGGGLHYECSFGGGETHYVCIMQGSVRDVHDVVDATVPGAGKLGGTIDRSSRTYSPPNCVVTDDCADTGSFELLLQH